MEGPKKRDTDSREDIVDALIGLPLRNLESRIRFLEDEIRTRESIWIEADSRLGKEILAGKEQVDRTRYVDIAGPLITERRKNLERLGELEERRQRHFEAAFRDMSPLRSRLQEAREELDKALERRGLVHGISEAGGE